MLLCYFMNHSKLPELGYPIIVKIGKFKATLAWMGGMIGDAEIEMTREWVERE